MLGHEGPSRIRIQKYNMLWPHRCYKVSFSTVKNKTSSYSFFFRIADMSYHVCLCIDVNDISPTLTAAFQSGVR